MPAKALLTFVHVSDTHLHPDPHYVGPFSAYPARASVEALIAAINGLQVPVDFILHTGDIAHNPTQVEDYSAARAVLAGLRAPVYYTTGNHDDVALMQRGMFDATDATVRTPYDSDFEINGVQVLLLDSHAPPGEDTAAGMLDEAQLAWLDARVSLPDARPLVVGVHHHVLPLEVPWLDTMCLLNGLEVHRLLVKARERLRGVFYGHIHESIVTARDGIRYYSVQSGWFQTRTWHAAEAPADDPVRNPGFNLVTLTDEATFVRFVRVAV